MALLYYSDPMGTHPNGWQDVSETRRQMLLDQANAMDMGIHLRPEATRLRILPLDFFPRHRLIAFISTDTIPPTTRFAIGRPNDLHFMDWTREGLYAVNQALGLQLDKENCRDYLRFALEFITGPQGRFLLVEKPEDLPWRGNEPGEAMAKAAASLRPLKLVSDSKAGFILSGTILFDRCIIALEAKISRAGEIILENEDVVATDAPAYFDPVQML